MKKLFCIGLGGIVISGMALDSRLWWVALLALIGFTALVWFVYPRLDVLEFEPMVTKQKKEENREETFQNWISGANVPKKETA